MSTKVKRNFEFKAAVYFEGIFLMNNYKVSLTMNVETDSIKEQIIAMDRIKYLFQELLANSVFVQDTEKKVIENYINADLKVCTVPEEPYDQIITILLLSKVNAISEGRLEITDIELLSEMSDDVAFIYDDSILLAESPFNKMGWWNDSGTSIANPPKPNKKEKIVKLSTVTKMQDWALLELDWKEKETCNRTEVVFTPHIDQ